MAIIDEAYEIRQGLHQIKCDEAAYVTGADLDNIGLEYNLGRDPLETDQHYRQRVLLRIRRVISDAAAAEFKRRQEEDKVVFLCSSGRRALGVTAAGHLKLVSWYSTSTRWP